MKSEEQQAQGRELLFGAPTEVLRNAQAAGRRDRFSTLISLGEVG
jgi:hypothetical protein